MHGTSDPGESNRSKLVLSPCMGLWYSQSLSSESADVASRFRSHKKALLLSLSYNFDFSKEPIFSEKQP